MLAQCPAMGRRRKTDLDLPPRLYRRGDRFYYVTHERRWIPLGTDKARALRLWADQECLRGTQTVAQLVDRYVADYLDDRAESTRAQYRSYARTIAKQWPTLAAPDLQPWMIARWRDATRTPGYTNGCIVLLRMAYATGIELGYVTHNPAKEVRKNAPGERDRYLSDEEFRAIREAGAEWFRIALDLLYLTAMRPCDLYALRWDAIGDRATVRQRKTKRQQAFIVSDALAEAIEQARSRPVLGLYVAATDNGRPLTRNVLGNAWRAAVAAAGVQDAQLRDVRAKAATDAEEMGIDPQALLGHASRKMSERYLRLRRTHLVQPLRAKL